MMRTPEGLYDVAHASCVVPVHEHLADGRSDLSLEAHIALKHLGAKPATGARCWQLLHRAGSRDQIAG